MAQVGADCSSGPRQPEYVLNGGTLGPEMAFGVAGLHLAVTVHAKPTACRRAIVCSSDGTDHEKSWVVQSSHPVPISVPTLKTWSHHTWPSTSPMF